MKLIYVFTLLLSPMLGIAQSQGNTIIPSEGMSLESVLRGVLGMCVLLMIAILFSHNRKAIAWKTVGIGLAIQLLLAFGVLRVAWVRELFELAGRFFLLILDFTRAGSNFLFGNLMDINGIGYIFVFQILPTIIFFSALTSILFYYGIIQLFTRGLAWVLSKSLKISGAESLSVTGNIFLGQTEAPLMIKSFLEKMTKSEILLVMIGGMATVAGGVLASYINFLGGNDDALKLEFAKHLLAASVMAAPGAVVISKILYPQDEPIPTMYESSHEKYGSNIPIMWLIGVAKEDMMLVGQLLGIKLAASEFVGYTQLAVLKNPEAPMHLMYQKSVIMSTYLLCGFANFASIGIQIGGIGSLAPNQRKTLSEFGLKAVLGGTLASLMSATIAGMILG